MGEEKERHTRPETVDEATRRLIGYVMETSSKDWTDSQILFGILIELGSWAGATVETHRTREYVGVA